MTEPRFETFTLTRRYAVAPGKVFAAFADPEARAAWSPPSPEFNMRIVEGDFRPGGRDLFECGPGPAEGVTVETLYHAIQTDRLIHFTELLKLGPDVEGSSLVTVVLDGHAEHTDLTVTLQAVSLGDPGSIDEVHQGWDASLSNLGVWLTSATKV